MQRRFVWPDSLHRTFVAAIFNVGLKASTPVAIHSTMQQQQAALESPADTTDSTMTTERIKSHLQKFRLHAGKSQGEFMASYDKVLKKLKEGEEGGDEVEEGGVEAGRTGAQATYAAMNFVDGNLSHRDQELGGLDGIMGSLSDFEKMTPVGISLGNLVQIAKTLADTLAQQRATSQVIGAEGEAGRVEDLMQPEEGGATAPGAKSGRAPSPKQAVPLLQQQVSRQVPKQVPQQVPPQQMTAPYNQIAQPPLQPPIQALAKLPPMQQAGDPYRDQQQNMQRMQNTMRQYKQTEKDKWSGRRRGSTGGEEVLEVTEAEESLELPLSPPASPTKRGWSLDPDLWLTNNWDQAGGDQLFDFLDGLA